MANNKRNNQSEENPRIIVKNIVLFDYEAKPEDKAKYLPEAEEEEVLNLTPDETDDFFDEVQMLEEAETEEAPVEQEDILDGIDADFYEGKPSKVELEEEDDDDFDIDLGLEDDEDYPDEDDEPAPSEDPLRKYVVDDEEERPEYTPAQRASFDEPDEYYEDEYYDEEDEGFLAKIIPLKGDGIAVLFRKLLIIIAIIIAIALVISLVTSSGSVAGGKLLLDGTATLASGITGLIEGGI